MKKSMARKKKRVGHRKVQVKEKRRKRAGHMKVQAKEKEKYIWAHEGPYKRFPCPQVRVRRRGHE